MSDQRRVQEKSEEILINVGLAQYHPTLFLDENFREIKRIMDLAGAKKRDIVCFSHDFLGPAGDDGSALAFLRELARKQQIEILTGRISLPEGHTALSVLIARDGSLVDSILDGEIKTIATALGATMVLSEVLAYSAGTDELARKLRPKAMIMQANAISLLELEAIKELAIERSFSQAHLVVCTSDVGPCADELCLGTSLAVFQGEILVEADVETTQLVEFSVDMSKFIDYDELRDPVVIPELLRQKYQ